MQIKQIRVYNGHFNQVYASVIATNDKGEVIIGNTGLQDRDKITDALSAVVSALESTQSHASLFPEAPKKAK